MVVFLYDVEKKGNDPVYSRLLVFESISLNLISGIIIDVRDNEF